MFRTLTVVLLLGVSCSALAFQEGLYYGGGFSYVDLNVNTAEGAAAAVAVAELQGGYKHAWWGGVEARIGLGLSETGNIELNNSAIGKYSLDHFEALYYRAELLNDVAKLYGLLGFANVSYTEKLSDFSDSQTGMSYGVGVGFTNELQNQNWNFEIRNFIENDTEDFGGFTITYDRRIDF